MKSTSTIDKVYDQYQLQDYNLNSDNLNPKREMLMGQVKQIEKVIQDLTDDIVRKRISPKTADEVAFISSSFGNESPKGGIGKNLAAMNAGSSDGTIFNQGFLSDVEEQIALLGLELGPITVDCEEVLKKYNFKINESEETEDDDGELTYVINSTSDIDSSNNKFDTNKYSSESETTESLNNCELLDLSILKIFIAILKIFQKIVKIIQFLLELPTVISELIQLVAQCWINPPSIALFVQIVLDMVTAIIVNLISMLLKFLWDLLGMDCIAVQSTQVLDSIQNIISAFKNTAAKIDIGAVGFYFDNMVDDMLSIKDLLIKSINDIGEDWNSAVNKVKEYFSEENLENLKDLAANTAIDTLRSEYNEAVANYDFPAGKATVNSALTSIQNGTLLEDAKEKAISEWNKLQNFKYKQMEDAVSAVDAIKESLSKLSDSNTKVGELVNDPTLSDLEIS
ncbi:MAG: hypothetical protein HUJ68_04880 [Clostridia bacterium]|nr:hypothetical protein [Clostridia bacterium]